MKSDALPVLYRAANRASAESQRRFVFVSGAHLVLLMMTGLVAAIPFECPPWRLGAHVAVAVLMFTALVLAMAHKEHRTDDKWFACRAIAENTKAAAWRFAMEPSLQDAKTELDREISLTTELREIEGRFPQASAALAACALKGSDITEEMRSLRRKDLKARLQTYKQYRLGDQIQWYSSKAATNAKREAQWGSAVIALEALAVLMAIGMAIWDWSFDAPGFTATAAACVIAWTQNKRFSDLANTYGVASRDLNGISTHGDYVSSEQELKAFVELVEGAISREHRMWLESKK